MSSRLLITIAAPLLRQWFLSALVAGGGLGFLLRAHAPSIPRDAQLAVFMITMFCIGLTVTTRALVRALANWRGLGLALAFTFGLAPCLAAVLGRVFFEPGTEFHKGWILTGCAATTISSAVVYARVAGGNSALGLVLSSLSNVLSAVVTPALVGVFLSSRVDVPVGPMMRLLCAGVIVPVLAAQLAAGLLPRLAHRAARPATRLSQIGIVVVVFMSMCRTFHDADITFYAALPGALTRMVLASLGLYLALTFGSFSAARKSGLSGADAIAVAYISGQKTLAATVVLADRFFSPMATLPIIVYHFAQLVCGSMDKRFFRARSELSPRGRTGL